MNVPACGTATPSASTPDVEDDRAPAAHGDLFAALVAGLTAPARHGDDPAGPLDGHAPGQDVAATDEPPSDGDTTTAPDPDAPGAAAALLSGMPPALTALIAAAAQAGAVGIVPATGPVHPVPATQPLPAASAATDTPVRPTSDLPMLATVGTAAANTPPVPPVPGQQVDVPGATTPAVRAAAVLIASTPGDVAAAAMTAVPASPPAADARDDTHRADPTSAPGPSVVAAASVPSSALLATRATTPHDSAGMPITRQVAEAIGDNVARLVSRGNGMHRLTLQLQPAALGDVRVVLTVRAGQVHVALAAGTEAQAALLRDAPELHRLLQRVGSDQTQIVFRDLSGSLSQQAPTPAASAQAGGGTADQSTAGSGTGQPTSGQQGAQLGPGTGGQPQDRRAWTPATTSARDGGQAGPGRPDPDRPIDPATRVRAAGVDVTM